MEAMPPFAFFLEPFVWNACVFDDGFYRFGGEKGKKDGEPQAGIKLWMGSSVANFS